MRVCFLNHDLKDSTGAGRFGLNLAGRLREADSNLEIIVLTTVGSGHPWEQPILSQNLLGLLFAWRRIRRIFKRSDLIHALDGYPYGVIAALALIGLDKKLFITAIGTGAVQPLYRWYGWLLRWAYRRADRVVAISHYTRREILKEMPNLAISVINHAVDTREFNDTPDARSGKNTKSPIDNLKPYILSVGGWKKRKGFEYSFAAYAELVKKFPDLSYVICGIGQKPHLTDPLGITGKVFYFKNISWPLLKMLYRHAELFMLLPCDDEKDVEGFGFAFLEAAAAGLPVVGTYESGAEDAVDEGVNGFLVPPRDAPRAAQAAGRILASPELRGRFRRGSLEFARRMNWPRVIEQYLSLYRTLMRGS